MATGRIGVTPNLRTRWSKAPAGGTTSLSGLDDNSVSLVYDAGFEAVYRNGVLLSRGNDYTATNGTTITLIDATIAGDIIEVFANQAIPLTSTYTQAVADGKFINNTLVDAKGDILTATAADTPARLAVGSNDQVLTADSSTATGLKWAAVPTGGMTLISTTTFSGASVTLSSIPATYNNLRVVLRGARPVADGNNMFFRFNADSTANRHNYTFYNSTNLTASGSQTFGNTHAILNQENDDTSATGLCFIDIPDYTNTTTWKMANWIAINPDRTTSTSFRSTAGVVFYNQTGAISSLQFLFDSTNANGGSILLYGVK